MDQINWHYVSNGQKFGPVPQSQLEQLLATQQLPMETPVWSNSMPDWLPARNVPAFAQVLAGVYATAGAKAAVPRMQPDQSLNASHPEVSQASNPIDGHMAASQLQDLIQQRGGATPRDSQPSSQPNPAAPAAPRDNYQSSQHSQAATAAPRDSYQSSQHSQAATAAPRDNYQSSQPSPAAPASAQPKPASSATNSALLKSENFYSCYLKNAYRVLGIPGATSQQDLKKTIANIRRQAKVGKAYSSPLDLPWLGVPIARSERDLHDAETKLLNPETRIRERLLWFHSPPEEIAPNLTPEEAARQAIRWAEKNDNIALHDAAVLMQYAAMAKSPQFEDTQYWSQAMSMWKALLAEESYWIFLCELDQQQGFEPASLSSDIFAHRDKFIDLISEPIVLISKDALNRGNQQLFALATSLINTNANATTGEDGLAGGSAASSEITDEFHRMMNSLCEEVVGKINDKIDRNEKTYKKHRAQNIDVCGQCEVIFEHEIEPILKNAKSVLSESDPNMRELRETAAATLESVGNGYTWADDYDNALRLLEKALKLAEGTSAEPKITESLEAAKKAYEMQKMFGEQKRVNMAPLLFTMNTVGFTVWPALHEEPEPALGSKRAIYYFVMGFLPIFPLASYRVIFNGDGSFNFISSIPLDKFARIHQAVILVPLISMMIFGATYKPSPETLARQAAERTHQTDMIVERVKTQKAIVLPEGKYDLKDMVHADDAALEDLEERINKTKPVLEKKDKELTAAQAQIEDLQKLEKPTQGKARSPKLQALIDAFRKNADEYNGLIASVKATIEVGRKIAKERDSAADTFNAKYASK